MRLLTLILALFTLSPADTTKAESFIRDMYDNVRYEDYSFIEEHCTARLKRRLKAAYDYEGEGYAVWLFRSGVQDGPDDTHGITAMEREGKWFTYDAMDMGVHFIRSVKVKVRKDRILMDAVDGFVSESPETFEESIAWPGVTIVDVRTAEEWAEGHIGNAINIDVLKDDFAKKASQKLRKGQTLAIYCKGGRRSKMAARILSRMGFSGHELNDGYTGWKESGR